MHWYDGMGGPWMLIFWFLLILGAIIAVVRTVTTRNETPEEESALKILKKRYARGEINKEQFREMKKEILD